MVAHASLPALERLIRDRRYAIETLFSIQTKNRGVIPFKFNRVQDHYWRNRSNHDIVLKPRQMGFTSLVVGEYTMEALCVPNTKVGIIAHSDQLATEIMDMVHFFWESIPDVVVIDGVEVETVRRFRVGDYSSHVVSWPELGSSIRVGTAGSIKFGRGVPLHRVLCTEVAFWDSSIADAVLAAVESAMPINGRIVLESTANGAAGMFNSIYQGAKMGANIYKPHFYPWTWDNSYRIPRGSDLAHESDRDEIVPTPQEEATVLRLGLDEEQLRFRRTKQKTLKGLEVQEFAEDDVTAFIVGGTSLFDNKTVQDALTSCRDPLRRVNGADVWQSPIPGQRYIIGVDVSSGYGLDPADPASSRRKLKLDYSAAVVLNQGTMEHVATLHGAWNTKELAERVVTLAKFYNDALLAIEANGPGESVLNTVVNQLGYYNIYYAQRPDTGTTGKWGWWTDVRTKPMMVDEFRTLLEAGAFRTYDARLLGECRTYAQLSPVKVGALPGSHDDIISAAMIACVVRAQAPRLGSAAIVSRLTIR